MSKWRVMWACGIGLTLTHAIQRHLKWNGPVLFRQNKDVHIAQILIKFRLLIFDISLNGCSYFIFYGRLILCSAHGLFTFSTKMCVIVSVDKWI